MDARPNIILIITDQQRADTIGALGAPWMHTPVLDRLVREGAAYTNCFVTSPVCVASRASLFMGMYPHAASVFTNFQPWEPNWVHWLAAAGYHCASIGKMHINPYDSLGGFHQRFVVENKDRPLFLEEHDRAFYDEWDKALHTRKLIKPSRYTRHAADPVGYRNALGDHGHIQKWAMYDCVARVPMVFWSPGRIAPRIACDTLVQLMDISRRRSSRLPGSAYLRTGRRTRCLPHCRATSPPAGTRYTPDARATTSRTARSTSSCAAIETGNSSTNLGEPNRELFDLRADPAEVHNLWRSAEHDDPKNGLIRELQEWSMRSAIRSRMPGQRKPQQPMLI